MGKAQETAQTMLAFTEAQAVLIVTEVDEGWQVGVAGGPELDKEEFLRILERYIAASRRETRRAGADNS